jgi:hypothetical protein
MSVYYILIAPIALRLFPPTGSYRETKAVISHPKRLIIIIVWEQRHTPALSCPLVISHTSLFSCVNELCTTCNSPQLDRNWRIVRDLHSFLFRFESPTIAVAPVPIYGTHRRVWRNRFCRLPELTVSFVESVFKLCIIFDDETYSSLRFSQQ